MTDSVHELDHWRERLFGWIPKHRVSRYFLLANMLFILGCTWLWPMAPGKLLFGWWPMHHFLINVVFANVGALIWGLYYYKWWPELQKGDDI